MNSLWCADMDAFKAIGVERLFNGIGISRVAAKANCNQAVVYNGEQSSQNVTARRIAF